MSVTGEILPLTETVAPADEAGVVEALRAAFAADTPVYPIGGGTRLDYGTRPIRPGIGLSLAGLDQVIDYPADDMTITVQAGITMAALAKCLAEKQQRLPVDVAMADRATLGGAVATGLSGPRRYAYGTLRDYVIGIRAVDGRGTAFAGGGRVVKNAAGYNLCRLMVGSLGTLGAITQVTLMVRPLSETSALVVCELPEWDDARRLLTGLVHTETLPVAIELLAGRDRRDLPALDPMPASGAARLVVGFEGSRAEVDWSVGRLEEEWHAEGVRSLTTVRDGQAAPLWDALIEFPAQAQISVPCRATVDLIEHLLRLDPEIAIAAHAGDGLIRVAFSPGAPDRFEEFLRGRLRPAVTSAGGKMVLLGWPDGAELTRQDVWGPPDGAATLMQAVKDRFDPKGLLNPGRFNYKQR